MQSLAATPHTDDLTQARREFERWRRSRPRGERIPAVLWEAAVGLARDRGVSKVSMALRLDYYALQRRVGEPSERMPLRPATPRFVEVALPSTGPSVRCQIELADQRGGTVRVELTGVSLHDLVTFVRGVSRSEP